MKLTDETFDKKHITTGIDHLLDQLNLRYMLKHIRFVSMYMD